MRRIVRPAETLPPKEPEQSPTAAQLATRALLRRAEVARRSLPEFYRFVIRHEITHKLLEPAPHQVLAMDFLQHHDRAVLRQPIGTGKTYVAIATTLWLLGNDPTQRAAVVSRAQRQSSKPLLSVAAYITEPELSGRLALVFPHLQRSHRVGDPWSGSAITVERPAAIRDPSVVAAGLDTKIGGSRWSWLVADDTVDDENSRTPDSRADCNSRFDSRLVSRLDPLGSRAVVTNTPWDREDLTYHLELEAGWPTLSMDVYGYVWINNADPAWMERAEAELIRPSATKPGRYRLRAHDPDDEEKTVLWAERYPPERIEFLRHGKDGRGGMLPREFARLLLCEPFAPGTARCQKAWVDQCKRAGEGLTLMSRYQGDRPTFCGIDLGIGTRQQRAGSLLPNDLTVFFVFALLDDRRRQLVQIESGRWSGRDIVDKIADYYERYRAVFMVETTSGQDFLRQWALDKRSDIVLKAHNTNPENKHDLAFGVESVFAEMQQAAWVVPSERGTGRVDPEVQSWIDEMLYYQPPPAHTGDRLMACWIARELVRKGMARDPIQTHRSPLEMAQRAGGF